jgi:uncharacterized protein (TIGR00251 family)
VLQQNHDYSLISVKITPNSSHTKISGKFIDEKNQEYLKINVAAVPEDGKANAELIKFLAKIFKIPKSKIEILRGETARIKVLKLSKPDNDLRVFLDLALRDLQ